MARFSIRPTQVDKDIAHAIERHTDPRLERGAEILTWGADEKLLVTTAAIGWLLTRKSEQPYRRLGTHVLLCSLLAAALPHVLKSFVEQERPDRQTISG